MRVFDIYVAEYDWTFKFFISVNCYYTKMIERELRNMFAPQELRERAGMLMGSCVKDVALTFSNPYQRKSLIVLSPHSSSSEFMDTLEHEIRHGVDHLASYYGIESGGEEIAYLTGYINKRAYPYVKDMLCAGCRKRVLS